MESTINKLLIILGLSLIFGMQAFAAAVVNLENADCPDTKFNITGKTTVSTCIHTETIPEVVQKGTTSSIGIGMFCGPLPWVSVEVCPDRETGLLECRLIGWGHAEGDPYTLKFKLQDGECVWDLIVKR